jgi:hypothetical protein
MSGSKIGAAKTIFPPSSFENFLEFFSRFMQHLSSQTTTRRLGGLKMECERNTYAST